ncbi:hypothetical protein B0H67DRAFT_481100 [Lasiosphaeris hirsuta]|uniref:ATP adenylyltransferase n=1 Tax=Lasiosphaeris hirsuta TaxID=260670 RepID=A0AA40B007_9PEZI|nr:hypothetical protein B0H67DRAFT_481100 [Lasiosphaeris hirsuta]
MEELRVLRQFDKLVETGLVLYDDKQEVIEHLEGGIKFRFILTSALSKKPTLHVPQRQGPDGDQAEKQAGSDIDTAGFEMQTDIGSGTHFLAANKFCFARPHLMLLTRDGYQKQYKSLLESDIEAAWSALAALGEDNYVAFFNCGRDGGCSRMHKHIQLMPMPNDSFASFLDSEAGEEPDVAFHWFYRRFPSSRGPVTPIEVTRVYTSLLEQATRVGQGRSENAAEAPPEAACPHNMILTRRWIVVLPRQRAAINKEAGANALGMLGVIAVATKGEMDGWLRLGLMESLKLLGVPK